MISHEEYLRPISSGGASEFFIDNQINLSLGVHPIDTPLLRLNKVALAKLALIDELPVVLTITGSGADGRPAIRTAPQADRGYVLHGADRVSARISQRDGRFQFRERRVGHETIEGDPLGLRLRLLPGLSRDFHASRRLPSAC